MKTITRIAAFLLTVLILCGCGDSASESARSEKHGENEPVVALIPLDDRPNNLECMEYLAQSLGYELLVPDTDLFATCLNEQPLNSNGSQSGDRGKIYEWLVSCEESDCDRYIIFMDQLLSGGLVNSRTMCKSRSVTVWGNTVFTEEELMQSIIELLGKDENNRVFLLDTVMRLAPTVDYKQWTLEDYINVRAWASVPRAKTGNNPKAIISGYRTGEDGENIDPAGFNIIEKTLTNYLSARERKLKLGGAMFDMLADYDGIFSVLMGIDDSSEENCIQKNEIKYFKSRLRKGDALLSGVDDMGYKALAKLYLDETEWKGCKASVLYFGENENKPASAYDFSSLDQVMDEHFAYFGIKKADDAELCFAVLTAPADKAKKDEYLESFFAAIDKAFSARKAVVLMDASNGAYGEALRNGLIDGVELGKLISYAGTLDLANLTGVAISHGVSRYALLKNGRDTRTTQRGFERCMADVLVKDLCYRTVVRNETTDYVKKLKGNPDNFYNPRIDEKDVLDFSINRMNEITPKLIENMCSSSMITCLEPYTEVGWGDIQIFDYHFLWHRTFELTFDVFAGNAMEAD